MPGPAPARTVLMTPAGSPATPAPDTAALLTVTMRCGLLPASTPRPPLGTTYSAVADLGTILVVAWEITLSPCSCAPLPALSCLSWMVVARGAADTPDTDTVGRSARRAEVTAGECGSSGCGGGAGCGGVASRGVITTPAPPRGRDPRVLPPPRPRVAAVGGNPAEVRPEASWGEAGPGGRPGPRLGAPASNGITT